MKHTRPPRHLERAWLIVGALGFVALGTAVDGCESLEATRQSMQTKHAHRSAFPGNRTLRLFNRLGVIHSTPSSHLSIPERWVTSPRKRTDTLAFWGVGRLGHSPLPSVRAVPASLIESKAPILSIYLKKRDWRTLRVASRKRGRSSEVPAYVSFFDHGAHVFTSGAGVRPHGGRSRTNPESNSYRIYLRETYGVDRFPDRLLSETQIQPLRRVVLKPNESSDNLGNRWHFVTPLAFDIARQAGAMAPLTRPVILLVNRKRMGLYLAIEYLDEEYLESLLGHSQFTLVRTKLDRGTSRFKSGDLDGYQAFKDFVRNASKRPLEAVSRRVDLDNLCRWFVSMMICGTSDAFQGPLIHDDSTTDSKWFWINWDMDNSFMSAGKHQTSQPWEFDVYDHLITHFRRDPRSHLLRSLIRDQPDFRFRLLQTYLEIINHRVTDEFLAERVRHYESEAHRLGLRDSDSFDRFRTFLDKRSPIVRQRLGSHLGETSSWRVVVSIPAGWAAEVDGFLKITDYAGWYYPSTPLRLDVPAELRPRFKHWLVDGRVVRDPRIELAIDSDTVISAVLGE